jgi:peptide/nickel transport system substrate-binding protein
MSKKVSRRQFIRLSAMGAVAGTLAACGSSGPAVPTAAPAEAPTAAPAAAPTAAPTVAIPPTIAPAASAPTATPAAAAGAYQEAPMLAELSKAGTIPPVAERLPKDPLTTPVIEKIGTYGGEWRSGLLGGSDDAWMARTIRYDGLVRWDLGWTKVIPDIATGWEVSPDGTTYTFFLREGMKWSDGKPYTTADIAFYMNDNYGNAELNPGGQSSHFKVKGEPATVETPDDITIVFKFAGPNGLFLQRAATPDLLGVWNTQAEYAKQFHKSYNEKADDEAKAAGFPSWVEQFQAKVTSGPGGVNARISNIDLPTINGWLYKSAVGSGERVVTERNPYYWKVDEDGNQLPYIDRHIFEVVQDREVLLLKTLNGEIDFMDRHTNTLANKPVIVEGMEKGDYRLFLETSSASNTNCISLNLTHKNPVLNKAFNDKQFRIALSHAINRQEVIDTVYLGQGFPAQPAPNEGTEFFDQEYRTQFTEYDPDKAMQILDEAGYKAGADGIRADAEGNPVKFVLETATGVADRADAMELVVGYWKAIGIGVELSSIERTLFYTRKEANDHDANVWGGDGGVGAILEPRWYFPYSAESNFGEGWQYWYNNPNDERAIEPPEPIKKQMELYDQLKAEPDLAKQSALFKELLVISKEQFLAIGVSSQPDLFGIAKNNFRNVPESIVGAYLYPTPGPANPHQFFFESA